MTLVESLWFPILLGVLAIILVLVLSRCILVLWRRFRMRKDSIESSVDPPYQAMKDNHSRQIISKIHAKVELINGECYVKNGDKQLTAKCNAALAEMDSFQREFLMRVPEGKPNKLIFTEVISRDENGCVERKAYFEADKAK